MRAPGRGPRRLWVALVVAAGAMLPVSAPAPACAEETPRAVLVVDTSGSVARYCVALPNDPVTGIELIQLASEQHGLSYRLGFGGKAVCMLAGVGARGDDCFGSYPDFWAYWRGGEAGEWTWSSSGAAMSDVGDGDVEGWSWGSGDGPESHAAPPVTPFEAVCTPTKAPVKRASPVAAPTPSPRPTPSPTLPPTAAPASPPARDRDKNNKKKNEEEPSAIERAPESTPSSDAAQAPPTAPASDSGPPAAGVAGLAVAGALAAAGTFLLRRRPPAQAWLVQRRRSSRETRR